MGRATRFLSKLGEGDKKNVLPEILEELKCLLSQEDLVEKLSTDNADEIVSSVEGLISLLKFSSDKEKTLEDNNE